MVFSTVGFPGVQIGTHVNDWNLDAEELRPIFAVGTYTQSRYKCIMGFCPSPFFEEWVDRETCSYLEGWTSISALLLNYC